MTPPKDQTVAFKLTQAQQRRESRSVSVLRHAAGSGDPVAFFGASGAASADLIRSGHLEVVERREPLGTRYVRITDLGRAALTQEPK